MNLKEAFRFQNKLQALMIEAEDILSRDQNITEVKNTHLRKKVMPEAEDETTVDIPSTEYSDKITDIAEFLLFLLAERETLSIAIHSFLLQFGEQKFSMRLCAFIMHRRVSVSPG